MLLVLVDADNVAPRRVQPVLDLLAGDSTGEPSAVPGDDSGEDSAAARSTTRIVASGRPEALARLRWPARTELLPHSGWQRADIALAAAYAPSDTPLILVTGDGDFGLLAARHPGPVLVISGAASNRLRDSTTVVDPATEGIEPIRRWLAHQQ